jgi:NTE family protein
MGYKFRTMKVGLVLGAGGVMGGAWLTGGLDALARETGWDPADADYVVGTSAGSMIGALCASGIPPWFMVAHSMGESFDEVVDARGRPASEADRSAGAVFRVRHLPSVGPGSWPLIFRSLASPTSYTAATVLSGWLPKGMISTEPLREQIRRVVPEGWSPHPNLWIVACDYATGKRVAFGRDDAPEAELADAVAASCAIPGFYHPVTIAGRRYVDGGIRSTSNLDVLRGRELDLVICLNPTSTLHPMRAALNPSAAFRLLMNRESGRRLGSEAKKLRAEGTDVILIQPTRNDLAIMGNNLMSTERRNEAIAMAQRTVAAQLRDPRHAELLEALPKGAPEKVHRPDEQPSRWPRLQELRDRVARRSSSNGAGAARDDVGWRSSAPS